MSDNIDVDEEVVEQLTGVADTMAKLLEQVMERHDDQTKDMDHFRFDLGQVRDSIRHIAKVLHEGNGERPLIARVAVLEEQIVHINGSLKRLELDMYEEDRRKDEQSNIDEKGKWGLRIAIISALAALGVELFRLLS